MTPPAGLRGGEAAGATPDARQIRPLWLGRRPYGEVLALQERLLEDRTNQHRGNTLLLLEHEPVVTFGRLVKDHDLRVPRELLGELGVALFETGRGGNATYHGPGQLVAYPIFDLKPDRCDVRRYVRDLGEVMIRLVRERGVAAGMLSGAYLGIWADPEQPEIYREEAETLAKIGAIGVRLSRFCTMHGLALNLSTDLSAFARLIYPCGIADRGITSLSALTGETVPVEAMAHRAAAVFGEVFGWGASLVEDASELPLELV